MWNHENKIPKPIKLETTNIILYSLSISCVPLEFCLVHSAAWYNFKEIKNYAVLFTYCSEGSHGTENVITAIYQRVAL